MVLKVKKSFQQMHFAQKLLWIKFSQMQKLSTCYFSCILCYQSLCVWYWMHHIYTKLDSWIECHKSRAHHLHNLFLFGDLRRCHVNCPYFTRDAKLSVSLTMFALLELHSQQIIFASSCYTCSIVPSAMPTWYVKPYHEDPLFHSFYNSTEFH